MATAGKVIVDPIRVQLGKITASPLFSKSGRLTRFLRFVVENALDGGDQPKEYHIGVSVFDRGDAFDPRIDPIVRVQAAKLRSKLVEYYATEGVNDPIVITLPKGSYVPVMQDRATEIAAAASADAAQLATARSRVESARPADARPSIAVLPFLNMSSDPENEYFSDGLTEEIINVLTTVPDIRVVARTSVFQYKGRSVDIRSVGAELSVRAVLEGSVRRAGNRIRVTVQFIDTADGYHLWSETFDREMRDVFAIQDEIALAIVNALRPKLQPTVESGATIRGTSNAEAYSHYLKGRYHWNKRTPGGLREAIQNFHRAIEADSQFAPAHSGLSDCYVSSAWAGVLSPLMAMPKAEQSARRAIDLDKRLAEAYASLASVASLFRWNWAESDRLFQQSIELDPGYAPAYRAHSWTCLLPLGRFDDALKKTEKAYELDPLSPVMRSGPPILYYFLRRYDEAIEHSSVNSSASSHFMDYWPIGLAFEQKGQYKEAIETLETARSLAGSVTAVTSALGHAYAVSGQHDKARSILRELSSDAGHGYVSSYEVATLHAGLGNRYHMYHHLDQAARERASRLVLLGVDPRFDPYRNEAPFQSLIGKLGVKNTPA